ncbi:MAG: DMT family transporter [Eubacteriales bacterium]|nr:DMT family transporter [Eubacteriales bacterium]
MNAIGKLTLSMIIFGTIGIFRRLIPLSSGLVAMSRGLIGVLFLLLVMRLRGDGMDRAAVRRKLPLLCLSGAAIGVNWILLFEAYNYTSVATATLCYYLAPMFVILASPLVLREKLTLRKLACVSAALLGMVFVSGVLEASGGAGLKGVLLGLGAAVLYASVVLMNKQLGDVPAYDRTIVQLGSSAAVLLPYVLLVEEVSIEAFTPGVIALLLVVGIVHTGIAYALYFGSLMQLKAQTAAILSYIDPVVAVLLSALVLREHMSLLSGLGAVLVLGAAVISELPNRRCAH